MARSDILILFAHPALEKSRVHRVLAEAVSEIPGVHFHDLYEAYPEFLIDVPAEQKQLLAYDRIILQHPLYWYSVPAIVKEWLDLVLEHGWAYGKGGDKLRGKRLLSAITTGGGTAAYQEGGFNGFTIRQFLAPVQQTARLCGMDYSPPFTIHGTHKLDEAGIAAHGAEYVRLVKAFRDGRMDWEQIDALTEHEQLLRLNDAFDRIIQPAAEKGVNEEQRS